jgi:glycosyltransferase involved in cell wall biosynthesis
MRVAIDALLLSGRYSGVERAIDALLRHIASDDVDVTALVGSGFDPASLDGCGLDIVRLPASNRSRLRRILFEEFRLRRHLGGFDLLHAPGYCAPRRPGVPVVLTVYDLVAIRHPELARRSNALHYRWRLPRSARSAARVIVPLRCVAEEVESCLGVHPDRIRILPLGVDDSFSPPSEDELTATRAQFGLERPYILFVGNLEPKKNLPTLLRAFARLVGAGLPHDLVLAGKPGWKCRDVRRLPEALGIAERVRMLGYVDGAHLRGLYGAADVFAFPSLVEGFGLPPLEAMACGTPAVTSDIPALRETLGDAAERVAPTDVEALACALRRAIEDSALRDRLRAAGLARAATFTWRRAAEATRAVYREVVR